MLFFISLILLICCGQNVYASPVAQAVQNHDDARLEELLAKGANPNQRTASTELWGISVTNCIHVCRYTPVQNGTQPGYTPLELAVHQNRLNAVLILLAHGANPALERIFYPDSHLEYREERLFVINQSKRKSTALKNAIKGQSDPEIVAALINNFRKYDDLLAYSKVVENSRNDTYISLYQNRLKELDVLDPSIQRHILQTALRDWVQSPFSYTFMHEVAALYGGGYMQGPLQNTGRVAQNPISRDLFFYGKTTQYDVLGTDAIVPEANLQLFITAAQNVEKFTIENKILTDTNTFRSLIFSQVQGSCTLSNGNKAMWGYFLLTEKDGHTVYTVLILSENSDPKDLYKKILGKFSPK